MLRLFETHLKLKVVSGFIYLPLLFDPAIDQEVHDSAPETPGAGTLPAAPVLLPPETGKSGSFFVQAVKLSSLLGAYPSLEPADFANLRRSVLQQHGLHLTPEPAAMDDKLKTILLEILPHFILRTRGPEKKRPTPAAILDFLSSRAAIPKSFAARTAPLASSEALKLHVQDLQNRQKPPVPPPEGLISGRRLRLWFKQALAQEILREETARWQQNLQAQAWLANLGRKHHLLMLYIAATGSLEVDGCGFQRLGRRQDDYYIYKRTGEYVLKDYYGRLYLFPDCRVAVSTRGAIKPVVLDKYKHPFLLHHTAGQAICLSRFRAPHGFTAKNIITALEEGLGALYYGYNHRKRNGYHSLDVLNPQAGEVTFDDYRIDAAHPKLISGKVTVTNDIR
jgi:hypothetical protein